MALRAPVAAEVSVVTLAVKMGDPLETEKLIVRIVETAARSHSETLELVESLTGDQIVAIARSASAFMPAQIGTGPANEALLMALLTAAMKSAAVEFEMTQLQITITPLGVDEPRLVRILIVPEAMQHRAAKSQPLGARKTRIQHGG